MKKPKFSDLELLIFIALLCIFIQTFFLKAKPWSGSVYQPVVRPYGVWHDISMFISGSIGIVLGVYACYRLGFTKYYF